jgi:glutamine cyclotransferase
VSARAALLACATLVLLAAPAPSHSGPRHYGYRIIHAYPHDPGAFTQGLEYHSGFLYEGTGLYGRSSLRKEKLETGEVVQSVELPREYFGEGITLMGERVLQLTWLSHVGFIYNLAFHRTGDFPYPGEGWGLANDGKLIYLSDGSSSIRVLNPQTLAETRRIAVHDGDHPINMLNELECVRGQIYANIWHSDRIARISPQDGSVTAWIDLTGILSERDHLNEEAVLNGIAYDAARNRLFITGKLWPKIFQIEIVPK